VLLLRSRARIARGEFESAQQEAVRKVQELIAGTTSDYFRALGARQVAAMRRVVATAARAAATLSARYFAAGNIPALDDDLRQAEALEAEMEADEAEAAALAARGELAIRMGLGAGERMELADSLPLPAGALEDPSELAQVAYASRLDLAAARRRAELLAQSLGVTRRFRWLGGFEVGFETERETDGSRLRGPTLSIDLPIFHRNEAALARATAQVDLAEAEARAIEREIGTRVAVAHANLAALRTRIERQRTLLLPLRERVVARTQEQVNFMLVGVFELLSAKREEYDAWQQYLESLRDYRVARAELALAVGRVLDEPAASDDAPGATAIELPAAPAAMDHSGHDMGGDGKMDHSGHDMGGDGKTDHSGYDMGGDGKMDHSGHDMPAAPADEASDDAAEAPHHEHEGHAP
jgi:outer membrane protein, heavy metal efflux system